MNQASTNDLPAGLSQPALRALHGAGFSQLQQFTKVSEQEIAKLHGVGPTAIAALKKALREKGLSFATGKK